MNSAIISSPDWDERLARLSKYSESVQNTVSGELKTCDPFDQAIQRQAHLESVAQVGYWEIDLQTREMMWSKITRETMEFASDAVQASYPAFLDRIHPEDRSRVERSILDSLQSSRPFEVKHRVMSSAGSIKQVEQRWEIFRNEGRPVLIVGTCRDITRKEQSEKKLARISGLSIVLSQLNELIHRTEDQTRLFEKVCRIAVEEGNFRMAAVMLRDKDTGQVKKVTHAGEEDGYFSEVTVQGTIGTALDAGAYDVCNDTLNEPRMGPWRKSFEKQGYLSTASFPIKQSGQVIGALVFFSGETHSFQDDELRLLSVVSDALSFACQAIRLSKELREREAMLSCTQRTARVGSWMYENGVLTWSDETHEILGLTRSEFKGTFAELCDMIIDEDRPEFDKVQLHLTKEHPSFEVEYRIRRKDGQVRWIYERGQLECGPDGHERRNLGVIMDITDRKQGLEALEESLAEFRHLSESMPQIVWVALPSGENIYVNPVWVSYTGMSVSEAEGNGFLNAYHPDDRDSSWNAWNGSNQSRSKFTLECRIRRFDGVYRWWLVRATPRLDAAGNVVKWYGTCTDIHDIKMADLEILRTNRALKIRSGVGEALIRANGEQELLNQICEIAVQDGQYCMAYVGYARQDENKSIDVVAHSGERSGPYVQNLSLSWDANSSAGNGPAGECIRLGKYGMCRDIETDDRFILWRERARSHGVRSVLTLPMRYGGKTLGLLGLYSGEVMEVSEQELSLLQEIADGLAFGISHIRSLQEQENAISKIREQASLLDQAHDAIVVNDSEGRIIFWNMGAQRTYGWRAEEALGQTAAQLLRIDPAEHQLVHAKLREMGKWEGRQKRFDKLGRELTLDVSYTLIRDRAGEIKTILSIATDITEKSKLEEQILRVQRMESIGTLAGGMAHDLNNLLAPILLCTDLLKSDISEPHQAEILDTIHTSARQGAELVKQVLTFSRGLEGKRQSINFKKVLGDVHKIVKETFPKNIAFEFSLDEDLWNLNADPTHLHQTVLNLCVNARDAMPRGGKITVSLQNKILDEFDLGMNPEFKTGSYVVLSVKDTGSGIPKEIQSRIFDPFFTTKEVGKGTGLGLSAVHGIVKAHGGFIDLTSVVDRGTTFTLYFPADVSPFAAAEVSERLPSGGEETILVVDDEPGVRNVVKRVLEKAGYRVHLATNGAEAISTYAERGTEIAAVLTDMSMPIMDGPTSIIALRAMNPQVIIIGSSGRDVLDTLPTAVSSHISHFISKPYTKNELLQVLANALSGQAAA